MCADNYIPKKNIIVNRRVLTPGVGDELVFCKDEKVAYDSYHNFVDNVREPEYEPIEEVLFTDIFMAKELEGEVCHPAFIGNKMFGFVGCRTRFSNEITQGHFFLYETEVLTYL